jgi:uncharacterized membrane protein YphA (DoxX/SURF4 family)
MNTQKLTIYAPSVLRIGVSSVYLWFGTQQFLNTMQWIGFIPKYILQYSPVDAPTLVHFNGAIELVFGTALLIGIFSRTSALVLALHMAHITLMVGYDAIGVRDFGIAISTFAVSLFGSDALCLESYLTFRKPEEKITPLGKMVSPMQYALSTASADKLTQTANYIKEEQRKGTPMNSIRDSLFMNGLSTVDIDKAYKLVVENPNTPPATPLL